MISSITVLFLVTCYLYFTQYYKKLIDNELTDTGEAALWIDKLKKKLVVFLAGAAAIVLLYAISFTVIKLSPGLPNVKMARRCADILAVAICVVMFYLDKKELDIKLAVNKAEEY